MCKGMLDADVIERWKTSTSDYCQRLSQIGDHNTFHLVYVLTNRVGGPHIADVISLREHIWDWLHSVSWKDVESVYRDLYSTVTVLLVSLRLNSSDPPDLEELTKLCDMGLLLGNGPDCAMLHKQLEQIDKMRIDCAPVVKKQKLNHSSTTRRVELPPQLSDKASPLNHVSNPGLVTFLQEYLEPQKPVVLRNVMDAWLALDKWMDVEYFLQVGEHRTVPIETGRSYLGSDSASKLVTLKEFTTQYILGDSSEVGYLAQHQLLKQIPALQKDIDIPDYCALQLDIDEQNNSAEGSTKEEEDVKVQVWLGPVGTLSPLHHDCYYNLLCQVAGYKYVRLYHPDQSSKLHPLKGIMSNNSQIDLTNLDSLASFPSVREAVYSEYILGPGEMLFIPRWHWHLVLAVDNDTALKWRKQYLKDNNSNKKQLHQEEVVKDVDTITEDRRPQFAASVSLWWGSRIEKKAEDVHI